MEIVDLTALPVHSIEAFGSVGLTAAKLVREPAAEVTVLRVEAGGEIGSHPAPVGQLLVVLSGGGEVRSGDGPWRPIGAGQAALWAAGEEHATRSKWGLTVLAIESTELCNKPANGTH